MDAAELVARAEKKASSGGGFFSSLMSSSSIRNEEAAELYVQAANQYRLQRDSKNAGKCFEKAANLQLTSDTQYEAANTLVDAYKAYKLSEPSDAARVLNEACNLFTRRGEFRRAASSKMDLGALYENEIGDEKEALNAYEAAGEWYFQDGSEAQANKAFLKVADLAAMNGDYLRAVKNYDDVADRSKNNRLTKWSLKEYFLKATLCLIAADDAVAAEKALDKYVDWSPEFASQREYILLTDLLAAIKDGDEETFTTKLAEYDRFSKLDKWQTTILLKIKEKLFTEEEDDLL